MTLEDICIRVTPETKDKLTSLAEETGESIGRLIDAMVDEWYKNNSPSD